MIVETFTKAIRTFTNISSGRFVLHDQWKYWAHERMFILYELSYGISTMHLRMESSQCTCAWDQHNALAHGNSTMQLCIGTAQCTCAWEQHYAVVHRYSTMHLRIGTARIKLARYRSRRASKEKESGKCKAITNWKNSKFLNYLINIGYLHHGGYSL